MELVPHLIKEIDLLEELLRSFVEDNLDRFVDSHSLLSLLVREFIECFITGIDSD